MILKYVVRFISTVIGMSVGYWSLSLFTLYTHINLIPFDFISNEIAGLVIGGILFFILSLFFTNTLVAMIKKIEQRIIRIPVQDIIVATVGLIIGLLIASLISTGISYIGLSIVDSTIPIILYVFLGYLGFYVGLSKRVELTNLVTLNRMSRDREKKEATPPPLPKKGTAIKKVLDSSVLIDHRITEVAETGFLEGELIIPQFVLNELQLIADSEDPVKRNKGRLGLECVKKLKESPNLYARIDDKYKFNLNDAVDNLIMDYALKYKCAILTTDYNLNRVSELRGIRILNVNDLSNAVKPILSNGERFSVHIVKEGKEANQGVAYTDDGTMIVVENGKKFVGQTIDAEVQSILQTSAGRIIFVKPI